MTDRQVSRVLFSIGILQVLTIAVGLLRAKALSVLLGPAQFGVVSTIDQVVITVAGLSALSLPFIAMKFMARSHSEGEEAFRRTYVAFLRALAVLAIFAVVVASALLVADPGFFGNDLAPYRTFLHVALLSVPAFILNILFVNATAAAQRAGSSAAMTLWVSLALAAAAVTGAVTAGIGGLYVATVVAGVITTAVSGRYVQRTFKVPPDALRVRFFDELRQSPEIVRFAIYIYVGTSAYSLTMLATRYFVFSRVGETEAGLLQAVMSIALTVGAVLTPMNNLYLAPLLNRQMPTHAKSAAASDFAGKMIVLLVVVSLPIVLFPRLVLTVLFSSQFAQAATVLFLFVLWQCLYNIVNIFLQLLIGLDDVLYWAAITVLAYVCTVVLFPMLVPVAGIGGVAIALTAGMGVCGIAAVLRLRRRFAIAIDARVWLRGAFCLAAIAAAGYLFHVSSEWTPGGSALRVLYAMVVLACTWALLRPDERLLALEQLRRRKH